MPRSHYASILGKYLYTCWSNRLDIPEHDDEVKHTQVYMSYLFMRVTVYLAISQG